jgi:hypothetical protein
VISDVSVLTSVVLSPPLQPHARKGAGIENNKGLTTPKAPWSEVHQTTSCLQAGPAGELVGSSNWLRGLEPGCFPPLDRPDSFKSWQYAFAEGVLSLTVPKSGTCPQLFGRREIPKAGAESDYDHDHFLEGLLNLTVPKSGNCPQLFGRREIPKRGVES